MELKEQVYLIAKHYLSHQVNNTLLKENWRNVDYDRRYLTYLKDYEELRKILDDNPISKEQFIETIDRKTTQQNTDVRAELFNFLMEAIREFKPGHKKIIEISERLKKIEGNPTPIKILLEMRKIVEEMYKKGQ